MYGKHFDLKVHFLIVSTGLLSHAGDFLSPTTVAKTQDFKSSRLISR